MNLLRKVDNKPAFKRYLLITLAGVVYLNLAWEVIQMPLYKDASFNIQAIAFCGLAAVVDAIMVLLLYFLLALIYKDPLWIKHLIFTSPLIIVLIGGTGAVLVEIWHLSQDNWAYASSMPIIPFVNVGLSPVLQFMILPVLSYYLSFYFLKKNYGSLTN